ncbi:MAG TPA: insulinase family protein, partial [Longimicrobium sp.]|nr:insulinase family protein [Longimicrobium sp.]
MSNDVLRRAPARPAADRTRRPPAGPAVPLVLPPSVRFTLDGGTRVEVAERRGIPEVYACLAVEAGSAADPAGQRGAAELAARMLSRGAGGRGRLEMARWLDRTGAFFRVVVHHDVAVLMLFGLREAAEDGLAFLASAAREPDFAEGEAAGARAELLAEVSRQAMDPAAVADHALAAAVYGDHPYGRAVQGTPASVAALDAAAAHAFHRARYGGAGAVLVVSGDVDA